MAGFWMKASIVFAVSAVYLHLNRDPFKPESLLNKKVLVTGASSGIGEHIAYEYAKLGANVFVTARREELLQKVVKKCMELGRKGAKFGYVVADMSDYSSSTVVVVEKAVKHLGGLDHLILNHALLPPFKRDHWVGDESDLLFLQTTMKVNFLSYVHLATAALQYLKQGVNSRIGVISSLGGKMEMVANGPYSASKFALDGFFSSLNAELQMAKENVSITLCPLGFIGTGNGQDSINAMIDVLHLNKDKFYGLIPFADVKETALGTVKAVTRGDREFYYPSLFGFENDAKIYIILRHVAPWLLSPDMSVFK